MDFQEIITRAGQIAVNAGHSIIEAAEKEDIGALRPLAKQLNEVMDILNTITLVDQMMRAAKDN